MANNDKWSGTNPWLGLASYTEGTPLYGRGNETVVLTDIIKNNLATIVFGKSGVGKSSLLGAGISPALRKELYIPIKIRLVHNSDVPYNEQIEEEVRRQVNCTDMLPSSVPSLGLWDFFHRNSFARKDDCEECTPVIILDQFEEIYTLTNEEHKADIHDFFQELSSLLNDIKPDNVVEKEREYSSSGPTTTAVATSKLKIRRVASSAFAYTTEINFRFVICLREDKLYLLERNSANIPSLKNNRFNLQALSVDSAMEVVMRPRPDLFTEVEATAIIDKLADMGDEGLRTLDPAILSLFLYKYYEKHGTANADNIFADYYLEATQNVGSRSMAYLEDHLLTLGGYRNQVPLNDALSSGVAKEEIDTLLSYVILRTENRKGIDYIEFSHDRLCIEAKNNREERNMREQARKARRRMMLSLFIFGISAAMLAIVGWLVLSLQTSEEGRLSEMEQKELFKQKNDSLALLDAMNKRQRDSLMVLNEKNLAQKNEIERQRDALQLQNRAQARQLATIQEQQREIEELDLIGYADKMETIGDVYFKLKDYSNSKKYYNQALKKYELAFNKNASSRIRHAKTSPIFNIGLSYQNEGNMQKAEEYYLWSLREHEELIREDYGEYIDDYLWTVYRVGVFFNSLCNYKKAEGVFENAFREIEDESKFPRNARSIKRQISEICNECAFTYANSNQFGKACETIDKAIAIAIIANKAHFYDTKGEILLMQGKKEEALEMWKKVIELNPNFLDDYPDGTELSNGLKNLGLIK